MYSKLRNFVLMLPRLTIFLVILAPSFARGQIGFTSPLPDGVLQVHGNHADMRVHLTLNGYPYFIYKLSSNIDTSDFQEGWDSISVRNGVVDTLLTVPKLLVNYALYWRTGTSSADTGGVVANLTPGHIMGIAGQSNAQGYTYDMITTAVGDIRMLINDSAWQPAHEPTGGVAGGPWIVMANELYQLIGDTLPIGIVNVAVGSSGLTIPGAGGQWIRNPANPEDTSVYGHAIDRFIHAGSDLECLCWIQGEEDAGGVLASPEVYRSAFATLMAGFDEDLGDSIHFYHLQIGGYDFSGTDSWPQTREAERELPPSTIVGTALGRSLDDELHYSPPTLLAVGTMFAGAILKQEYGMTEPMYPPLMPDTFATLNSINDGSILGRYCFSIGWNRGGVPCKLTSMTPYQFFGLNDGLLPLDTSLVWYRISPLDSTRVQIGLRNDSITSSLLKNYWFVTYDDVGGADQAPLATIDPVYGDTIFATACYELPVQLSNGPPADVQEFSFQLEVPNPTSNAIQCYINSYKYQNMTIDVVNDLGATLQRETATVQEGEQIISIPTQGLLSGNYWIVLRDENGNQSVQKAVIIH